MVQIIKQLFKYILVVFMAGVVSLTLLLIVLYTVALITTLK